MASTVTEHESPSKWPVILNNELLESEVYKTLSKQHKCRVSSSTIEKSVIYPLSGLAFLLIDVQEELAKQESTQSYLSCHLKDRVNAFLQVHRHSYAILQSPLHGENELKFLSELQMEFLASSMRILLSHNATETVTSMNTIAKAHCKPASDTLKQRLLHLQERVNDDRHVIVLKKIELSDHECQILLDGIGSIGKILTASQEEIMDCGLSKEVYYKLAEFMHRSNSVTESDVSSSL